MHFFDKQRKGKEMGREEEKRKDSEKKAERVKRVGERREDTVA